MLLSDLFGAYQPIVTVESVVASGGAVTTTYTTSPDFCYILSCFVFIVMVYGVLRLIGSLLSNLFRR